jgi:hypothetical protein
VILPAWQLSAQPRCNGEAAANRRFAAAAVMGELPDDKEQRAAWLVNNALNSIVQALSLDMVCSYQRSFRSRYIYIYGQ